MTEKDKGLFRSCDTVLTIERRIKQKTGYDLEICISCLTAAFDEILKEDIELGNIKSLSELERNG